MNFYKYNVIFVWNNKDIVLECFKVCLYLKFLIFIYCIKKFLIDFKDEVKINYMNNF